MATTRISPAPASWALQPASLPHVRPVEVNVQVAIQRASLVEQQVGNRKSMQRLAHGPRLHVVSLSALRLRGEHARNRYADHCATSTDRIGGRWRTASTHSWPSVSAKNEPLWVPK